MSINNNLARIRAKFDTSPPYDWEDNVNGTGHSDTPAAPGAANGDGGQGGGQG